MCDRKQRERAKIGKRGGGKLSGCKTASNPLLFFAFSPIQMGFRINLAAQTWPQFSISRHGLGHLFVLFLKGESGMGTNKKGRGRGGMGKWE